MTTRTQVWLSPDGSRPGTVRTLVEGSPLGWQEGRAAPGTAGYRADLPTDPVQLVKYLRDHPGPPFLVGNPGDDHWLFQTASYLLSSGYLPSRVQAALFRAVAAVPGMTVVPDAVDAAGRHGIAVRAPGSADEIHELIFSRDAHLYLGSLFQTLRGKKSFASARLRYAVVDRAGQLPQ